MALQEKVLACGVKLTIYGMVLRFVGGPLATSIGSLAFGLRSNTLRIAIIQVINTLISINLLRGTNYIYLKFSCTTQFRLD